MKFHCLIFVALAALGCGGTNTPAEHPVEEPRSLDDAPPPPAHNEPIPQFFWVEIRGEELVAAGTRVDVESLRQLASQEVSAGEVRGAAVTLDGQTTEQQALAVVQLLLRSGFRHVVVSSRVGLAAPEPVPAHASQPKVVEAEPAPQATTAPLEAPPKPVDAPSTTTLPEQPRIEVKQMGLHIGGGPNDPDSHAVYAEPIARRFEDIRQCYTLVPEGPKKASFGVDLLIPSRGGKAKIENYRTAIGGKDFHLCVLGVFGSIDFKGPGKATMVSYSVLFKPL